MDHDRLASLHKERFAELPLDCGQHRPGVVDVEEWRDWSDFETTPDQLRIEEYLDGFDLRGRTILHIGIGNSGLAQRFAHRAQAICGTSIIRQEINRAKALELENYRAVLHNKYSESDGAPSGSFDFIVDNNPTTFCCCFKHLGTMLDFYASRLSADGQVITDRVGLGWAIDAPGAHPRWGFAFDDLAVIAPLVGLHAYRFDSNIFVLARRRPDLPGIWQRGLQKARSIGRRIARRLRRSRALGGR